MPMQSIAQNLGAIDSKRVCPSLNLSGIFVGHSKAQHRHTQKSTAYDSGCVQA